MAVPIREDLEKHLVHLSALDEADIALRLLKVFEEVLGYDPATEISGQSAIKDQYVILALKIEGVVKVLVATKAATELRDEDIEQARTDASKGTVRWVILTNGMTWNFYRLGLEKGTEAVLAFTADLANDLDGACDLLCLIHRDSLKNGELDAYWERRAALNAVAVGHAIFTAPDASVTNPAPNSAPHASDDQDEKD